MPNTFTLIASSTVGASPVTTITFSSIPSTYTDLCLKLSGRSNNNDVYDNFSFKFNGSSSGYSVRLLVGNGASPSSASNSGSQMDYGIISAATSTASTFGNAEIYIPNYAESNNKSVSVDEVSENNATTAYTGFIAGLWSNSSAINQIAITTNGGSFVQYSTAYLYGIVKS